MKVSGEILELMLPAVAVALLVGFFLHYPAARLPQAATGGSVLDVAFGDAREVLGRAFVHKADSYFHGGVDMECEEKSKCEVEVEEKSKCEVEVEGCVCHHHHHHHEEKATTTSHFSLLISHFSPDPWRWINSHIRAPEVERHLEGAKAVEMMPWFWAAVKSDPHNIDAWTAAWYSAAHVMKDDALARRILDEAKAKNPKSAEIWFTEGRHLYKRGKGDVTAARASFEMARILLVESCGGDLTRLSESDRQTYDFTCNYIRKISTP